MSQLNQRVVPVVPVVSDLVTSAMTATATIAPATRPVVPTAAIAEPKAEVEATAVAVVADVVVTGTAGAVCAKAAGAKATVSAKTVVINVRM